jgi:alanine racemase
MSLTSVTLSGENILHNISSLKRLAGNRKICAVVKANAYGHGLKEIISLTENVVDYFQLDDIDELRLLRSYTKVPVLLLGYIMENEMEEALKLGCIPVVFEVRQLMMINNIGVKQNKKIVVHIEVDALLGRLGIPANEVRHLLNKHSQYPFIHCEYVYAHFSDLEDSNNLSHALKQHRTFLNEIGNWPYHIAATSGLLTDSKNNWGGEIIRLGIGMYGLWPSTALQINSEKLLQLKPVLSWKTKIAQVKTLPAGFPVGYGQTYITEKETKVAIIPQRYSDGYDRGFSNNCEVLIRGSRCPVIGRIAMNMFTVDVTGVPGVTHGDEVVLLGKQGTDEITAEELAERIGTINYEIIARISPLLLRKVC